VDAVTSREGRLRALFEAGVVLSSELSLDAVLQRLVEVAAELTGARYGALGVIDESGSRLERFITSGVGPEAHAAIGSPPRGRGILGALITDAKPLRLHELSEDPRSVGFPPAHPPMHTFLGVPVLLRGVAYGNLYLTEKAGGEDFTDEDEELVMLLAAQAAAAIENARLYEAATRWSRQLQSLNEVGNALATETDLAVLLDLVARRLRELLDARLVVVLLPAGERDLRFAAAVGEGAHGLVGQTLPLAESKSGRVLERRRSERVDSVLDDPEVNQELTRKLAARTGLWVPLTARQRVIGVIEAHDKLGSATARFTDDDLRLAETFAARAAVAVDLSERVARDALRRVVAAQELERRRLARELHDETGQALTSILLGLKPLEEALVGHPAHPAAAGLRELVVTALQDVRRLAVELRPKVLDDFGLEAALERLTETFAEQTGIRVAFRSAMPEERLPPEIETALFRVVQEALTNVVKHARASLVSVLLTRQDSSVTAIIEDDGTGFDPAAAADDRLGLAGMRERLALLDGTLEIESGRGAGTTLVAEVPVR
jgi:signal transduction histidine kinase